MDSTSPRNVSGSPEDHDNETPDLYDRTASARYIVPIDSEHTIVDNDDSDWDIIHWDTWNEDTCTVDDTPTYNFPSTWDGARNRASAALTKVGKASSTYYRAIADSGLGQAGWSIGGAFAATASLSALTIASMAVNAAGANDKLPRGFRNWLKGKEILDAAKKRALEAEKERVERKIKRELIAAGGLVEIKPGVYVNPKVTRSRAGSMASRRSSLLTVQATDDLVGGQRGRQISPPLTLARSRAVFHNVSPSTPAQPTNKVDNSRTVEESDEDIKAMRETTRMKTESSPQNGNPWVGASNNPAHAKSVFKDLETPDAVRHQLNVPFRFSPNHPAPFNEKPHESPYDDPSSWSGSYSVGQIPFGHRQSSALARKSPHDPEQTDKQNEGELEEIEVKEEEEMGGFVGLFGEAG